MKNLNFLKTWPIAHRGYHNVKYPENSLGAFKAAIKYNYAIELDITVLRDGTVICFHDKNFKRMTGLNKNVNEVTFDDIKNLKLNTSKETIPRFIDVLNYIDGKVPLLIEIKGHPGYKKAIHVIASMLNEYQGEYAIFSFNPKIVYWFKKHHPHIIRGQITSFFKEDKRQPKLLKYLMKSLFFNKFTKPDFISYNIDNLPNQYADKAKRAGLTVISYTAKTLNDYLKVKKDYDNVVFEGFKINGQD